MPVYRRGSRGPEVSRIQARLKELGYYRGPIDADFGGGTELKQGGDREAEEAGRLRIIANRRAEAAD